MVVMRRLLFSYVFVYMVAPVRLVDTYDEVVDEAMGEIVRP
jgi:hypothetical protein